MKRPACKRSQGKSRHKCSCCGSLKHRIETCPEPAAAKIQSLLAQVRKLTEGRPKHVLRQERKTRKTPKLSGSHKERAQKEYRGENKPRQASPAQKRRRLAGLRGFPLPSHDDNEAAQWLIEHHWVPECLLQISIMFLYDLAASINSSCKNFQRTRDALFLCWGLCAVNAVEHAISLSCSGLRIDLAAGVAWASPVAIEWHFYPIPFSMVWDADLWVCRRYCWHTAS